MRSGKGRWLDVVFERCRDDCITNLRALGRLLNLPVVMIFSFVHEAHLQVEHGIQNRAWEESLLLGRCHPKLEIYSKFFLRGRSDLSDSSLSTSTPGRIGSASFELNRLSC